MKNKTIKVPKYLYFIFGEDPKLFEVLIALFFGLLMGVAYIFMLSFQSKINISIIKKIVLVLMAFELVFNFIMQLFTSVDKYYYKSIKRTALYLTINFHPIVLMWVSEGVNLKFLVFWVYVILATLLIMLVKNKEYQKVVGFAFLMLGVLIIPWCFGGINYLISMLMFIYLFKMIYSFGIDQYAPKKDDIIR